MSRCLTAALLVLTLFAPALSAQEDVPEVARSLMEEAERARDAGRADEAIAKYQRVIDVAPNLASAYVNLGALYYKQGKVDDAYRTFVSGAQNAPADRTLLSNAAATAQQLGKSGEALTYVDRALETNQRDAALHSIRATILRALGRNEEALNALQQAVVLDPSDAKAQFSLGNLLFQLGRKEDAIVSYRHAVDEDRGLLRAWYNLGATLFETGRYDEALSAYKVALAPIEQSFAKGEKVDSLHARAYANLGAIYLKQQQWQPAIDAYDKALRLDPNDTAAHYNLGFLFFTTGKNDRAETEYRKALASDPTLPLAYLHLGELAYRRGDAEKALQLFRDGMSLFDRDQKLTALRQTGRIQRQQHRPQEAATALDQAGTLAPDDAAVALERALVARDLRDFARERALLEKILAKRDSAPLRAELVVTMLRQNDLAATRKQLDALPNAPELASLRAAMNGRGSAKDPMLAAVLEALDGKRDAAAKALASMPSPMARADAGLLLWQLGRTNEARPLITAAREAMPSWTALTLAAGEIALAARDYEQAATLLTSNCAASPFAPSVGDNTLTVAIGNDADLCARAQQSAATALLSQAAEELDRAVRRQDEATARRARQLADRAATLPIDTRGQAIVHFIRGTAELLLGSESNAREALNRAVALGLPPAVEAAAKKNIEAAQTPEPVAEVKPEPTSSQARHTVVVFLPDAPADEKRVAETITAMLGQVGNASGLPLQTELFRRADDARNFIAANRDKVGIVIANPEFISGEMTAHFQLTTREGRQSYRRVVIVPAKSAIKSFDDLRGHTISSVDSLRDAGTGTAVRVNDDFSAVANALFGKSDAAYVSESNSFLAQRARELRIVHTSAPQPMPVIAFAPMPVADRTALDNGFAAAGALSAIQLGPLVHLITEAKRPEPKKIEIAAVPPASLGLRMPGAPPPVALRVVVDLPKIAIPEE